MPSPFESVEVVPYRVWVHQPTGRQASLTGAAPFSNHQEPHPWTNKPPANLAEPSPPVSEGAEGDIARGADDGR